MAMPFIASTTNASLDQQRQSFLKAEALLKQNKISAYRAQRDQLNDYPLAPYLDYQALLRNLSNSSDQEISRFIRANPDLPVADRLNRKWLTRLAQKQQWAEFIKHYNAHPVSSTHYICLQQQALLNGTAQQKKAALKQARSLWLVANSQPKTCDPLFKAWMATGHPTSAEAQQRLWMSLDQGNTKLARYLTKKLTNSAHKAQADEFWKIYANPKLIGTSNLQQLTAEQRRITATLAYKAWYRQQPISASQNWIAQRDNWMDKPAQGEVTEYMGVRLNRNYHRDAIRISAKLDPDFELPELTETRIRNGLAKQDWRLVQTAIMHLPEEEANDPKWQYWLLIAERHLQPQGDHKQRFEQLAKDRSYYGFLAAELNQSPFQLNAVSDPVTQEQLDQLASLPAASRAGELFRLGRLIDANREWRVALSQMDENQFRLAGYLARSWGWHLQAIINAAKTERWDHVDLRFPHPHAALFKQHAIRNGLDLSFPVAIARQESAFLYNAQSRVGARGLMQLMPKTAQQTARKHKVPYKSTSQLYNPKTNITLGSAYLGDMLKRFNNNPAFASAAYNAGPHRVSKWLKQRGDLPLDIWIETIPFSETRKYVQNVLAFRVIYDRLEGRQASLLNEKQVELLALNQSEKTAL
ncbi:transglycosylase SLT domain-containing protein [Neptuniibacter halophilus]|uniref:transglycosylase SLT domain-containing protein n=1 Tax=Neptuniibacter halophilus TaxID=651666 RepID=UPI002573A732|nr:transglycosylase SLT domain-containing protein [Neptuniibacter halophilus]